VLKNVPAKKAGGVGNLIILRTSLTLDIKLSFEKDKKTKKITLALVTSHWTSPRLADIKVLKWLITACKFFSLPFSASRAAKKHVIYVYSKKLQENRLSKVLLLS